MRLFVPELQIGDLDGFTPETDIFGRKEIADGLSHLVATVTDPMVVAIDAQWGAGKTVFLKQWAGELRKAGFPVIYFDAFKSDYLEDPFAAIAAEILELVAERKMAATPAGKRFRAKALDASKIILRTTLRAGVKIATMNALDTEHLEEVGKVLGKELSDLEDRYLGEVITKQKENKATIEAFRDALSGLPALLAIAEGQARPLILIIDELDRCRPNFALSLLERMKHFFSVTNVHFVLSAHLDQLRNSVSAAYGANIDSQTYLQKFIHLTVSLRETGRHEHELTPRRFIAYLVRALEIPGNSEHYVRLILHVAEAQNLSLRTLERIMGNLALALATIPPRHFAPPPIIAGLCILKVTRPAAYERALRNSLGWTEASLALELDVEGEEAKRKVEWLLKWWRFVTDPLMSVEDVDQMAQSLFQYNIGSRFDILQLVANRFLEGLKPFAS